jgi:copper chaperone CopZ
MRPFPRTAPLVLALSCLALSSLVACGKDSDPYATTPVEKATPPTVATAWRGSGDTIEVTAWRLDCPGCVKKMKQDLSKVEGVVSVEADQETSGVKVKIADASKRDAIIAKIREVIHSQEKKVVGEDPT